MDTTHQAANYPLQVLQRELERRMKSNPRYSMRSFANSLKVSQTLLSLLLSRKKPFSKNMIKKMIDRFDLEIEESCKLLSSIDQQVEEVTDVEVDEFALISEWYHYAILSLLDLDDFEMSHKWISKRIGISELEVKIAVDRLKRMDVIDQDANGKWFQKKLKLRVNNKYSTSATRKFQKQLLEKATTSLEEDSFNERVISAITFAANDQTIDYARKRIHEFREQLCEELEEFGKPSRVYNFCLQFYPVSSKGSL